MPESPVRDALTLVGAVDGESGHPWVLDGGFLGNHLAFVDQLSFADMGAMPYMYLTREAILAEGDGIDLVVGPSLGTALLRVPAFRIGHD